MLELGAIFSKETGDSNWKVLIFWKALKLSPQKFLNAQIVF